MRAAVVGAGGVGAAVAASLLDADVEVLRFSRAGLDGRIDVTDERSVALAAADVGPLDLLFVATGLLHDGDVQPEKSLAALDPDAMMRLYQVNAIGPALVAKHFLPHLARGRKAVFAALSARVGSIGDNRLGGWHSYRASKAALNMLIRNIAIELGRRNKTAIAVGLHPGTVDTALSAPFQKNVPKGGLFTPERSAEALLSVIDGLKVEDSGGLFAWDGQRIPE